ncbi:aminopeptidase 2 [Fistulifera solaris]|uniref:Aminopeptidase n=1 Tax=Fistulifera solaris TaxID=1519565 RepID=A0A1Z5KL21_FISSO|nr:aminopeptidase 2 [Fistulifera solaris]|eukprot:GAX26976.1 aminopeptidase 2 [Fistulifera solaris]
MVLCSTLSAISSMTTETARLPLHLQPRHYDLQYHAIDLVHHTFTGRVTIHGKALRTIPERVSILLHALELQLTKATLVRKEDPSVAWQAEEFRCNVRQQTCEIVFSASLTAHEDYELLIDFHGVLNDKMHGFYRSSYTALDGSTITMATTQFEATDARRAFPCFDEPAIKATFQLTVTIPAHLQCISNTPMAATSTNYNGLSKLLYKTIQFQITPLMSTYLLAWVIGRFDGVSTTSRHIVTTVYTVEGKATQGQFCLQVASKCLDYYQDLFQISYPLTKSDLLAIPDFAAGAMENWGCVTYREAKILVDPIQTSESTKRAIARTVCHELAHQWFGNLVTMDWWTQLYLKEGVARFMEFVALEHLFPEWLVWVEFVQGVMGLALSLDSMKSSHPVEVPVNHPDEITEIFDAISYAKGASIIRMISSYIGMEVFMKGMRLYLQRHAYGNAVTADLWRAMEEVSDVPVSDFMMPWTAEVGFPLVQIAEDGSIQTCRFMGGGPEMLKEGEASQWPIPVTARVEGMDEMQGPWVLHGPDGDDSMELSQQINQWDSAGKWFKLNVDQTGFFRVAYSRQQWERLAKVMDPQTSPLSTTDRLGLLSDCFAAGKAGYFAIVDALTLVTKFGEHEMAEYAVWQELSENMVSLISIYRSEGFFPKFQKFIARLCSRQLESLGWDSEPGENARTGTLRARVIGLMGLSGDTGVMKKAYEVFSAYTSDPKGSPIPGDLQGAIFRCALRYEEKTVFDGLRKIYEGPGASPEEKRECLMVMGKVKDTELRQKMMDYVFWSGFVRLQDITFALSSLATSDDDGGVAVWNFFQLNYAELSTKIGMGSNTWSACVGLSVSGLTTIEAANEVEAFFEKHPAGSATRRLEQGLEVVRSKIMRRERDREALTIFLDNLFPDT